MPVNKCDACMAQHIPTATDAVYNVMCMHTYREKRNAPKKSELKVRTEQVLGKKTVILVDHSQDVK